MRPRGAWSTAESALKPIGRRVRRRQSQSGMSASGRSASSQTDDG
jgi:hypothetical protein